MPDTHLYSPGESNPGPDYLGANNRASEKYAAPEKLLKDPDAIVIGSGIGGLGIASLLAQKKGMRVLLLEVSAVPGGCTHCHELGGFEFNSGVDSIGDMDARVGRGIYRPTIDYLTAGQLRWAKMPDAHEICCFGNDDVYEWYSSPEKNIEWVERMFPGEGDVRAYYELEKSVEWWAWSWAATKLIPESVPEVAREQFYRAFGGDWRRYMQRTSTDVFRGELGFSERLASIFSYMYGNHGATPKDAPFAFHAVNLLHYRDGAYYPVGGPGQIAECIVPIIEAAGGQLAVSTAVDRILVEGDRAVGVRLEDGREVRSSLIISDASAYTTYMDMLDRGVSERHGYAQRFDDIGPSPGHVYLLLGYDEKIDLTKQIIWHMPTYDGISKYDLDNADVVYKKELRFEGMGGYVLSPSARDPVYEERYPDKTTVIALAEAPPDWVERAKTDPEFKAKLQKGVGDGLEAVVMRHMPELRDKTPAFRLAGVPMGCNPRAWAGSSLGLEPSGARFVDHVHWLRPKTTIENLYLTGQDAFSAGFAGSMLSSRMCYAAITNTPWSMLPKSP
jgi:phytoene dehydrogenase-like protein